MDIRFKDALVHANVHPFGTTTFDITYKGKSISTGIKPEELVAMAYPAIQVMGGDPADAAITSLDPLSGKPLDSSGGSGS